MLRGLVAACVLGASQGLTDNDLAVVKAGSICAAGPKTKEMGPVVYIGLAGTKECKDLASVPAEYVTLSVTQAAFIKSTDGAATKYVTDATQINLISKSGNGYFKAPAMVPEKVSDTTTAQYGFFSFGTDVGDVASTSYGYLGMAAYVMKQGELSFTENSFMIKNSEATACAVPVEKSGADTNCGTARKVTPGTFKFSLFGYGAGTGTATTFKDMGHFSVRTVMDFSKMGTGAAVTFNSGVAADKIGTTQITSVTIKGASSTLSFSLPQWFNYGKVANNVPQKKGSEMVKIRYAPSTTANQFYLDYHFAKTTDGIGEDLGFFVYDPSVNAASGTVVASSASAAGMSVLMLAAAAFMQM